MVTLKKDGKFYTPELKEITGTLVPYFNDVIEIEDGVTFEQFMSHIFQHCEIYDMIFQSHLGHYPLKSWIEEFNKPIPEKTDKMLWLEVHHAPIEINASGPNKHGINEVDIYDEFHGWGDWDDAGGFGGYGIEFTPLNELKQYPLKLNKTIVFLDNNTFKELCSMIADFRVYDVIGAILYEISWSGSPTQRNSSLKEMVDRIEESQKEIKEGKSTLLTADEFFNEYNERVNKNVS